MFKGGRAVIAAGRRGIRIPATSPVISGGGRCGVGEEEEKRGLTRGPGVAEGGGARATRVRGERPTCGAQMQAV